MVVDSKNIENVLDKFYELFKDVWIFKKFDVLGLNRKILVEPVKIVLG